MTTSSRNNASFSPSLPILACLGAVLFWGGSFSAMKSVVEVLGSWGLMWSRMVIALAVLLPFAVKLWPKSYIKGDWKLLFPVVLFQPCLYFLCESNALRFTTSSQAGIVASLVPLLVALGARIFLQETLSKRMLTGLLVSVSGLVWMTLAGESSEHASNPLLGNLLEVGAMVSATGYILLVKKLTERYSPWTLTALQTLGGAIFFSPGAAEVFATLPTWSPSLTLTLIYLGVCVTLGAFGLYNWSVCHITATQASIFINLVPVIALFLGWSVLGESLNTQQLVGAGLVFGGVWMNWRG